MRFNNLIFAVLFLLGSSVLARDCEIFKRLADSNLPPEFWNEYAEVSGDPQAVRKLLDRYSHSDVSAPVTVVAEAAHRFQVNLTKEARQDLAKARSNPALFKKVNEVMDFAAEGWSKILEISRQRAWNLEKLLHYEGYSIRLSEGYRLRLMPTSEGGVEIIGFSKHIYKH